MSVIHEMLRYQKEGGECRRKVEKAEAVYHGVCSGAPAMQEEEAEDLDE